MALCNRNQVKALTNYQDLDKKLGSMEILKEIKKIVYHGGIDNL